MVGLGAPHLPPTIPVMVPLTLDNSERRGGVLMFWDSESPGGPFSLVHPKV